MQLFHLLESASLVMSYFNPQLAIAQSSIPLRPISMVFMEDATTCVASLAHALCREVAMLPSGISASARAYSLAVGAFLFRAPISFMPPDHFSANVWMWSFWRATLSHLAPFVRDNIVPPTQAILYIDWIRFVCPHCHEPLPDTLEDIEDAEVVCTCDVVSSDTVFISFISHIFIGR